ncbi:PAS domain S-box protein [Deinococcus koreensis]|nr:PAS domain S-box protein [Deinococcus koreensis]
MPLSELSGQTDAEQLILLRSVLDHANDAVLITEAEPVTPLGPRILYANAAFTRMTGYTLDELRGQTPRILQGPRSDRRVLDTIREALQRWEQVEVELINYRKDGSEFWVELSISPVADARGWYTHWIAIQRDITQRKRSAEYLTRERAEVLELSAQGAPLSAVLERLRGMARHHFGTPDVAFELSGSASLAAVPAPGTGLDSALDGAGHPPAGEDPTAAWRQPVTGLWGRHLGTLVVEARRAATEDDLVQLAALAQLAALLIDRDAARSALELSHTELQGAVRRAEVLTALGDVLQQALTPDEVAARAMDQLGPALEAGSMLVVRLDGDLIRMPATWGDTPATILEYMSRPGLTLADAPALRQVAAGQEGLYVENYQTVAGALPDLPAIAYGVEPLRTPDGALQGFLVAWRRPGPWQQGARTLMRRAAGTLGLALERAESQARIAQQGEQLRQNNLDLQRERTFLSSVLANLSEGVVACDEAGRLTLFNDSTKRFHGVDAAPLPPEEWAQHYELFAGDGVTPLSTEEVPLYRAWQGEQVREAELVIRPRNGTVRQLLASGQPMFTPDGEALGAVVTMRDVTARKAAEVQLGRSNEELTRRNAELRAANDELEAFAYSASHDLRTPVRHIKSFSELARKALATTPNERASAHLGRVEAAADRMSTLIDAMLLLSRSTSTPLKTGPVNLQALFDRAVLDLAPELVDRDVEWRPGPLPVVVGDGAMLGQALGNLLANAVKFTRPRAKAVIEVWCEDGPDGWTILVRDNGVGFEEKYTQRLFGAFQRLHTDREFEGTGIGLATVRRIVLRHGGVVSATGALGAGATFGFTLPRER